ncbi:PAS domain S-box protein [Flectobacillus longus]|uniref:PAS domain S-box protein n=1 Tax=Flectobacillus longus TaxID=2984207 RepID=UPI0024B8346C|nr:PAS domain S-box protein [Flectobacillus longus]MDI9879267.1 PAS domain S-box protein [Flectobacillus longus]
MHRDPHPYKILIIEDNMGDFILIKDYLHDMMREPQISHCQTFKHAQTLLQNPETKFDMVLLDMYLPDKSGQALLDAVLGISKDSPVIILSGNSDLAFSIKSISLGVDDYLIKDDLRPTTLYKSIMYCIERRKKRQELLDSEQRYNELFDFSPQPMWVFDLETLDFMDVNLAAIKHYGYNRSEFLSMKISDIRPAEEISMLLEEVKETRAVNPYFAIGVFRHQKKNGEIIIVEIRANPIVYKGRKARVVLANDITEKIKYIESIELQNRNLSEIAWIQSHLVRAPLARIMGIIQMFEHNKKMPEIEKNMFFEHIITSAHELDELIMEISQKAYLAKTKFD